MVDVMGKYKKSLIMLHTVDSTNDWARANLSNFCPQSLTIVQAMEQTSGKGVSGPWHSPLAVGMYSSYVTFGMPNGNLSLMAYTAATSVLQMLDEMGLMAQVKWPNDIRISNKKLGGVLCETASSGDKMAIIVGIGLNINTQQKDLDRIDQPTTSLFLESGSIYCPAEIADRLGSYLIANYDLYRQWGFSPFRSFLENRLSYLGENIQVTTSTQSVCGKFVGLASNGALQLQISTGEVLTFYSGKITSPSAELQSNLE